MKHEKRFKPDEIEFAFTHCLQNNESTKVKFLVFANSCRPYKCSGIIRRLSFEKTSDTKVAGQLRRNWIVLFSNFKSKGMYQRNFTAPLKNIRFKTLPDYVMQNAKLAEFFSNHFIEQPITRNSTLSKFSFMN
jgi:hypothetical protein